MSAKKKSVEEVVKVDLGPVTSVKPCGSLVLLELLTAQEMLNTELIVTKQKTMQEFQAIVLAVGPSLNPENWGFKVGDRVVLSGTGVPVPNFNHSEREKVLMEPHSIKGVLS